MIVYYYYENFTFKVLSERKMPTVAESPGGGDNTLFVLIAEIFGGHANRRRPTMHQQQVIPVIVSVSDGSVHMVSSSNCCSQSTHREQNNQEEEALHHRGLAVGSNAEGIRQ